MLQFLLSGKNSSGRGVRMRILGPNETDEASIAAARIVGKDAINIEYGVAQVREMAERCLVAVTKPYGIKSDDELRSLPESAWEKLTPERLNMPGDWQYTHLFTAKDDGVICGIIKRMHTPTSEEIDAILGKALMVSED